MKRLMSGNAALGEAAILAGCTCYFGYPITPQNELTEYMARRMPEAGGVFIQSESEIAAINMVLGASVAGARAMTSSSSPGISLKQEGISYLAADELPAVIVNMVRGGPGMGNISPAQSDYLQATRGGGHGDYRTIVLAPSSVQELADIVPIAFDLADAYRNPVIILGDGMLGQMMEPVDFSGIQKIKDYQKDYILTGAENRPSRMVRSLLFDTKEEEEHNWKLYRKFQRIENNEVRCETFLTEDADIVVVAYGIAARIAKGAIKRLRQENIKAGLLRPITLWPFPSKNIRELAQHINDFFVFEMSTGQMIEDVRLALAGRGHVNFYGRPGGVIPTPIELARIVSRHYYQNNQAQKVKR
ncbi:MAG: 3-methyl-2-oxobutanoate dehydrogenase subunit VorB [Syntrophorhabdales bacterium]|nr:3-methyl-2-oxobutanoate dehydrogenase subunit VorB [Syntrophorhabdales bacterium]